MGDELVHTCRNCKQWWCVAMDEPCSSCMEFRNFEMSEDRAMKKRIELDPVDQDRPLGDLGVSEDKSVHVHRLPAREDRVAWCEQRGEKQ